MRIPNFVVDLSIKIIGDERLEERLIKLGSEDDRLARTIRSNRRDREVELKELERRWQGKFDQAGREMVAALDRFSVPQNSILRSNVVHGLSDIGYWRGLCQGEVINHFRASVGRFADRIGHILIVMDRSHLPWGDGSPEGEWARYVLKEILVHGVNNKLAAERILAQFQGVFRIQQSRWQHF